MSIMYYVNLMERIMDIRENIEKIEVILQKEIDIYKLLLQFEEKKIAAILNGKLHDIDSLCTFQNREIGKANKLRLLREKYVGEISASSFAHIIESPTLLDVIKRLPIGRTDKLIMLRLELITIMARVKHLNKLVALFSWRAGMAVHF